MTMTLRQAVCFVAALNLTYFGVELAVALEIGSVALVADSVDFLEDASVNLLIALALGWSTKRRARVGMSLACLLLVPGIATVWMAWQKFHALSAPEPQPLSLTAAGALLVNLSCAFVLARHRVHPGSLVRAAFLSARNDVVANLATIVAAAFTFFWRSGWPDLIVGLAIAAMNADAAREVWLAAVAEHRSPAP